MNARPRIVIPVPTSFDHPYNAQSWPEYASAVERAGGEAVRAELMQPLQLAGVLDGILLPGSGADVSPVRYGHATEPETAPADGPREAVDLELLQRAEAEDIPLLAICFGLQSLNVYRGGTLVQHLPPLPVNHRAGRPVLEAHGITLSDGARLTQWQQASSTTASMVNSSHHQAVAAVGDGLVVAARSREDGIVEALEAPGSTFCIGVQWHPERTYEQSAFSRKIFEEFVAAAKARRQAKA